MADALGWLAVDGLEARLLEVVQEELAAGLRAESVDKVRAISLKIFGCSP